MKQWQVKLLQGADSLQPAEVATAQSGGYDFLVKFNAASLNYRDIMIVNVSMMSSLTGKQRTHKRGIEHVGFGYQAWNRSWEEVVKLGSSTYDGVVRQYDVFNEQASVEIPSNLSCREAVAIPCAAVTAWNALYKGPYKIVPGNTVLTQGTGGVSIFALQFAKIGGAEVIATTSNAEKAARLKAEGADHAINYKEDPRGCQEGPYAGHHTTSTAIIRGILVGSRQLNEAINTATEINNLHPVIESRV
ncbi:hypothetical protein BDV34DRAFT_226698 [Aspergillus parasiticus]|uniref:Enoyl reductase (ER) domain-containing protein n=1 Tax=Aspergillus parasiticus TaxID=5067 RepID=A0A5N6DGM3_ASPPA|nr:hypothetical protein BDV34DRAFT_226698 [Aspergillus parasiticus]